MFPQQRQNLRVAPALRDGSICGLERPGHVLPLAGDVLRPLKLLGACRCLRGGGRRGSACCGLGGQIRRGALGGLKRGRGGLLRRPVVYVPVVLVEKGVVGSELRGGETVQVGAGEGGEEEVGFQGPAFPTLICRDYVSMITGGESERTGREELIE